MRDPRVLDAMNDPDLAERVKQFDLKKALEYASKKIEDFTQRSQRNRRMSENEIAKQVSRRSVHCAYETRTGIA